MEEPGADVPSAGVGQAPARGERRFSILVVDDEEWFCRLIENTLADEAHEVHFAGSAEEALEFLDRQSPDLVVSDYIMPGMNGLEFLERVREKAPEAARILCTGYGEFEMALAAINSGAVNRILSKPFSPDDLLASVRDCLEQVRLREENRQLLILSQIQNEKLSGWNKALEQEVARRTAHIDRIVETSIYSLAELAESRAQDIGGHLRRMQEFARVVAEKLLRKSAEPDFIAEDYIKDLAISTLLHDVGKVGIPDGVLFKPGKLTEQEFSVMKTHTSIGMDTLKKGQERLGDESFLSMGVAIAGYHHERWDGKGYPEGRAGEDIPMSARIVSIADVYDALTSPRVYKRAWSHEETVEYMADGSGSQFDPTMIEIFLEVEGEFRRIRENWKD